jgi:hypothetical protein
MPTELIPLVVAGASALIAVLGWVVAYKLSVKKDIASAHRARDKELLGRLLETYSFDSFRQMIERGDAAAVDTFVHAWSGIEAEFVQPKLASKLSDVLYALKSILVADALRDPGARVRRILGFNIVFTSTTSEEEPAAQRRAYRRNARIAARRRQLAIDSYASLVRIGKRLT